MKFHLLTLATLGAMALVCAAGVRIDDDAFGKNLGGWKKRSGKAAEYDLSGASYRTYKPEVSPTPDGGIFVSVRIDHVRGWLSSDDHAILEITVSDKGSIVSAKSNIAIQGRSITSDVIQGSNQASQQAVPMDRAVQIGADLVADLSAKLLREKIVEAGRVSFPAAIRHNYNQLFHAIRVEVTPAATVVPSQPEDPPANTETPQETTTPSTQSSGGGTNAPLEIKPYATPAGGAMEPKEK